MEHILYSSVIFAMTGTTKQKPIILFGAHPDDIEIGMGGTAKKLSASGREVVACVATLPNQSTLRKKEAAHSAKILGIKTLVFLTVPFKKFGFNRETVGALDALLVRFAPSSLFTHSLGDSHQDHLALTNSLLSAARRNTFSVYMYEQIIPGGITPTRFHPHLFVDISPYIEDKIRAIETHKSQVKKYGGDWLEGIRGKAHYRGNQIRTKFAETFEVVKIVNDGSLSHL